MSELTYLSWHWPRSRLTMALPWSWLRWSHVTAASA